MTLLPTKWEERRLQQGHIIYLLLAIMIQFFIVSDKACAPPWGDNIISYFYQCCTSIIAKFRIYSGPTAYPVLKIPYLKIKCCQKAATWLPVPVTRSYISPNKRFRKNANDHAKMSAMPEYRGLLIANPVDYFKSHHQRFLDLPRLCYHWRVSTDDWASV